MTRAPRGTRRARSHVDPPLFRAHMLGNAMPRTFLQKKVDNHWLSFAIDRVTVLKAVMKHIPELLPFVRAAYARLGRSVWGRRGAGSQPWRHYVGV